MMNRTASLAAMATVATAIVGGSAWWAAHAESVPLSEVSHIHGITVDPEDPSRLYLATHHGVWLASPEARFSSGTIVDVNGASYLRS